MTATSAVYTLGDLLDEPDLGIELVVGGERARSLPISGAHSIEVEHPSRWLDRDWLVLTTGVRLRRNAAAQRELIAELDRSGATAIAFGVGDVFKKVPPAMLAEARERDFPLVVIPLPTPFRAVIGAVYRATLSGDLRSFQRLNAMQRYLTDALGDEHPLETVIERLAELVGATAGVVGAGGELEAASGTLPLRSAWREIRRRRPATLLEFDADGRHCVAAPVKSGSGTPERWLLVASRGPDFANELTKAAAQATTPLLSALGTLDRLSRDTDRAARAAVLEGLLSSPDQVEGRSLGMRAAALGVELEPPTKAVLVIPRRNGPGAGERQAEELADRLQRRFEELRVSHLATRREGGLCVLANAEPARLRELLGELIAGEPEIVVGSGREIHSAAEVAASLRDARLAVERIGESTGERLLDFDDLDLDSFLVGSAATDAIAPKVEDLLRPLRENEPLLETLTAYFDHDLSVVRTARALRVHPNSLRYRLGRIEELTGRSLREPATIAALHLALLAAGADGAASGPDG